MIRFETLQAKAKFVSKHMQGRGGLIWGDNHHLYRFHPTLSETEIKAFEDKHKITLPPDYRRFIAEIGNGGMGHADGLWKLEQYRHTGNPNKYSDYLSRPFPHAELYQVDLDDDTMTDDDYVYETSGSICLAHHGCGIHYLLVVNGEKKGEVWVDDRSSYDVIRPIAQDFITWYDEWLDEVIKLAKKDYQIPKDAHP